MNSLLTNEQLLNRCNSIIPILRRITVQCLVIFLRLLLRIVIDLSRVVPSLFSAICIPQCMTLLFCGDAARSTIAPSICSHSHTRSIPRERAHEKSRATFLPTLPHSGLEGTWDKSQVHQSWLAPSVNGSYAPVIDDVCSK